MKICRRCGKEKDRIVKNNRPFFYCNCAAWQEVMALLRVIRERRPRREN